MSFKKLVERLSYRIAIPNLASILTFGSALFYILSYARPEILEQMWFSPSMVLRGEVWRIFTFLFYPLGTGPVFAVFAYMFFYMMATALEHEWGDGKFTVYVLLATVSTVALSFLLPFHVGTNVYIYTSIFLAFAYLYPEFVVYIFFILPVRMKYLAAFTWVFFGWTMLTGTWVDRFYAVVPLANFLLFFGRDIVLGMRARKGEMEQRVERIREKGVAFHVCATCKITEKSRPDAHFRVCTECRGAPEYCGEHLVGHKHIT